MSKNGRCVRLQYKQKVKGCVGTLRIINTDKKIFVAFVLNLCFSIFELVGGFIAGSISILSDSIHDFGDALSIGLSYFFERKSKREPDKRYTYGYAKYSILGSIITTSCLILGSSIMLIEAVRRIFTPIHIKYNSMMIFATIGLLVNGAAAFITKGDGSANQKAVNLHMLEDVLGWSVVFVGSIIMKFTNLAIIDPIMSIAISLFMLYKAFKHMISSVILLLDKSPIDVDSVQKLIMKIDGVLNVHHIHVWNVGENQCCATMHVVADSNHKEIKQKIRESLNLLGISHSTIELESKWEHCEHRHCSMHQGKIECKCCNNH